MRLLRHQLHLLFLSLLSSSLATAVVHPDPAAQQAAAVLPPIFPGQQHPVPSGHSDSPELEFTLRHIFHHGTHKYPTLHRRLDVPKSAEIWVDSDGDVTLESVPTLRLKPRRQSIQRLADRRQESIDALLDAGREQGSPLSLAASAWTVDEIWGPNVTDKETVLSMARIAADAYVIDHGEGEWQEVGGGFNYTEDFGWDNDGLRGHIFADTRNETVIIGIKGTSPAVFDGTETTTNDKINDNLFFSCCCGQGGQYTWHQVCDCQTSAYRCNSTCVTKALRNKNRYYYAAQEIYRNVSQIYPDADIWLAGHSLGGSTSSLVGLTYGLPVVTFEAPGEALPAVRLGLPTPPGYQVGFGDESTSTGGWHFGHTADPIFMGTCNTFSSVCTIAGYAMQSRCHTGLTCIYDTVGDLGWRSSSATHKIVSVIKDVLQQYERPAECKPMVNCTDCFNWEFYESNHSDTTTSTSTSTSTTTARTSTCKTPGWWGCLDETTTTGSVSTRSDFSTSITTTSTTTTATTWTTTTATSHCLTPGWFGCKDVPSISSKPTDPQTSPTSSIAPTTSPTSSHHTTSTCKDPGWFGCKDPVSTSTEILTTIVTATSTSLTVTTDEPSPTATASTASSTKSSCTSRKYFGFVCADPTTTTTAAPQPSPTSARHCVRRSWLGRCREWQWDGDGEWKLDL